MTNQTKDGKSNTILVELEVFGDPDDGMIECKTGCVDGNGKEKLACINEENIREESINSKCPKCGRNQQILGCRACGWENY